MTPVKLDRERSTLVVIDVQEAFRKAVPSFDDVARGAAALVRGAEATGVPILVTEQYPEGLGRTVPEVAEALPEGIEPIEKVCFSASEAEDFDLGGRDQALVCGLEAHVCVNQTAHDLIAQGRQVHLLLDCVTSRTEQNRQIGIEKMRLAGIIPCNVEMALFELMGDAKHEQFKAVQRLIK